MFTCKACNYVTTKRFNYNQHLTTNKHLSNVSLKPVEPNRCACGKKYKHSSSYYKHRAVCTRPANSCIEIEEDKEEVAATIVIKKTHEPPTPVVQECQISNDNIFEILRQNEELKRLLCEEREIMKNELKNILNERFVSCEINNLTVIQNNKFEINVFLNERCKDALSIMEFVDTLPVTSTHVEYTGTHGYVEGITKIFIDGLKQLDIFKRPIHCTDLKRKVMYFKGNDKWEKDKDKSTIRNAVTEVARKNIHNIKEWKRDNPTHNNIGTPEFELHMNIMRNALGGNQDMEKSSNKIIDNIAKEVVIDRKNKMELITN